MNLVSDPDTIGSVSAVQTDKVSIELGAATGGFVKAGPAGVIPIGSINSHVIIPAGAQRIVALVTSIRIREERGSGESGLAVVRELEAVMIGRFEAGTYRPGTTTFPSLFSPVRMATIEEVAAIFDPLERPALRLGEAVVAPDQDVYLSANTLLSRHCAVLGSTGSGKSCTVTAIIDGLLELDLPSANIVIFDSNGEYLEAFTENQLRRERANPFVIGPIPGSEDGLFVPHWFMDNEDHLAFLQASEQAQAPLLQRAVAEARIGNAADVGPLLRLRSVLRYTDDVRTASFGGGKKPQENLAFVLDQFGASAGAFVQQAKAQGRTQEEEFWTEVGAALNWDSLSLATGNHAWDKPITPKQREDLEAILARVSELVQTRLDQLGLGAATTADDFDAPRYYSFQDLHDIYLPARIQMAAATEPRIIGYATTLLMRLARLLADSRYDFMTRVPRFPDALSRYLRLILGADPLGGLNVGEDPPWTQAYSERASGGGHHSVTILDLSLVAHDVVGSVTALLGRLILGLAQRAQPRGGFPILLVLEEAHRYIPNAAPSHERRRSAESFERIAKEGRKYGVSLLLASQRPSELSPTVLAQCGTLIAHRLTGAEDQDLIRTATPFASREVLRQIPGLSRQHAIAVGDAVSAPSLVRIRKVETPPKSGDPNYLAQWRKKPTDALSQEIERVARLWERSVSESAEDSPEKSGDEPDEAGA